MQSFKPFAWMINTSSRKNSNQLEYCQKFAHNCLEMWVLGTNLLGDLTSRGRSTNLQEQYQNGLRHATNDVSRTTQTNLDVLQERRIDDYWNIDGSRDLSASWTGFTQFTL